MRIEIKSRYSGAVLFSGDSANLYGADLYDANLSDANLSDANLSGANLRGADLSDANLRDANLRGADLYGADLYGANLSDADLSDANLSDANLRDANLRGADLSDANLRGADLRDANLYGANLSDANLSDANLSDANLSDANLRGADLPGGFVSSIEFKRTRILPDEGAVIGWKKCQNGIIVKLRIPENARRSHASGRKCRAEFAEVMEVIGAKEARSSHDGGRTVYRAGETVRPDSFEPDWRIECAPGIHFFITRAEAEAY